MSRGPTADGALLRRWVDTWRRAEAELDRIRRAELQSVDTREAVRRIFSGLDKKYFEPRPGTSGLVEQQKWFALARRRSRPHLSRG